MKKESLDKALDIIIKALNESDIDEIDKIELMINISKLLENYKEDIEILQRSKRR